jgi:hypothetical protein
MIRNYLSSPDDHKVTCEFVTTHKSPAIMKKKGRYAVK